MKKPILILFVMFLFAGALFSQNSIQINDISSAETVHILIGAEQNTGDVLSIVANVYNEDGDFFISYGGNSEWTGSTHMQIRNDGALKVNLEKLYDGQYGWFFYTKRR